jgi:hypothetical protein
MSLLVSESLPQAASSVLTDVAAAKRLQKMSAWSHMHIQNRCVYF